MLVAMKQQLPHLTLQREQSQVAGHAPPKQRQASKSLCITKGYNPRPQFIWQTDLEPGDESRLVGMMKHMSMQTGEGVGMMFACVCSITCLCQATRLPGPMTLATLPSITREA